VGGKEGHFSIDGIPGGANAKKREGVELISLMKKRTKDTFSQGSKTSKEGRTGHVSRAEGL